MTKYLDFKDLQAKYGIKRRDYDKAVLEGRIKPRRIGFNEYTEGDDAESAFGDDDEDEE